MTDISIGLNRPLGSYGDGKHVCTTAYQAWLDSIDGIAVAPPGMFLIDDQLVCNARGITIQAPRGGHWIVKAPTFPVGKLMLYVPPGAYLTLDGMGFDGADQESWPQSLVYFDSVSDLTLRDCIFKRSRYMLVQLKDCNRLLFDHVVFNDWGRVAATDEGGAAVWCGPTGCPDITFRDCHFVDGRWSGIYFNDSLRPILTGCRFVNCKETGIFGGLNKGVVLGNQFDNIPFLTVSAHAMEIGGYNNVIASNVITGCDGEGIHYAGAWGSIIGNVLRDCARDLVHFPGSGAISVFTVNAEVGPEHINIVGNLLGSTGTTPYAIVLARGNIPASRKISDLLISRNVTSGETWGKAAIACDPSETLVCGANVTIEKV